MVEESGVGGEVERGSVDMKAAECSLTPAASFPSNAGRAAGNSTASAMQWRLSLAPTIPADPYPGRDPLASGQLLATGPVRTRLPYAIRNKAGKHAGLTLGALLARACEADNKLPAHATARTKQAQVHAQTQTRGGRGRACNGNK